MVRRIESVAASEDPSISASRHDCVLDTDQYPIGLRYQKAEVEALPITRHDFHGEWNYTIHPTDTPDTNPD